MKKYLFTAAVLLYVAAYSRLPIPGTPFSEYHFPAAQCIVLKHQASRIFVPANTFYLDDKLYTGEVTLKYREFTDQLDIVINRIPMAYHENGKQHILESGGMFELYAYGNGKQLAFAPQKKITVQLASDFRVTGGETFVFDRSKNAWKKNTLFSDSKESNEPLPENPEELWGDNAWNNEDTWQNSTIIFMEDGNQLVQAQVRNQSFATINVDKMDFYNCDRILREDAVPITADFKLKGIDQKLNSEIFVVYKKRNAVVTYYPAQFASEFKLLADEEFTIFTYSKDGKIAVLDQEFASAFNAKAYANKKVEFPMNVFSNVPSTKAQLATITGL